MLERGIESSLEPSEGFWSTRSDEEIICEGSWLDSIFVHLLDPWSGHECNEHHGQWTPLWYSTRVLVWHASGGPETNVYVSVLMVVGVSS